MKVPCGDSTRLLSYCTNVHPADSLEAIESSLINEIVPVKDRFLPDGDFGLELHLTTTSCRALQATGRLEAFRALLDHKNCYVFSLNGFPLGDFHQPVVKEAVYAPDWSSEERIGTTVAMADTLAGLLPPGVKGTISTLPGSFKPWGDPAAQRQSTARGICSVLAHLWRLQEEKGVSIRLALEPEPFCTLETVAECVAFWSEEIEEITIPLLVAESGLSRSEAKGAVARHLGLNLDASHMAVEFEDPRRSVELLKARGISVSKLHVSAAAQLTAPFDQTNRFELFQPLNEPKYLHQTFAADKAGRVCCRCKDLGEFLALSIGELHEVETVRAHFHMPLFWTSWQGLETTRAFTETLLAAVLQNYPEAAIVNETYTWGLLLEQGISLSEGLAQELQWTQDRIAACGAGE